MKIFAKNFRGFRDLSIDLSRTHFLVGDNSSGKSSILYLVDAVCAGDLDRVPKIDDDYGVGRFDYFSPYFDYADVDFGFLGTSDKTQKYGKVLTVRRVEGDHPEAVRCTHWSPGIAVTLKLLKDGVHYNIVEAPEEINEEGLLKIHKRKAKYKKVAKIAKGDLGETAPLFNVLSTEDPDQKPLMAAAWSANIRTCRLVSPIRALPERFYSSIRRVDAQGSHFARMLLDIQSADSKMLSEVNRFGRESKLFERLVVKRVEVDVEDPPLLVTVERGGKRFTLDQVGVGVSQVTPLLIDSLFSTYADHKPLLSQQPELHLHPIAQAALGSYLYHSMKDGLSAIYETHSSYLLDRFRAEFRDDEKKNLRDDVANDFDVLFCENTDDGNYVRKVEVLADGSLKKAPDEYHQFFVDELVRTMF